MKKKKNKKSLDCMHQVLKTTKIHQKQEKSCIKFVKTMYFEV